LVASVIFLDPLKWSEITAFDFINVTATV
jgi:hypothetical protein